MNLNFIPQVNQQSSVGLAPLFEFKRLLMPIFAMLFTCVTAFAGDCCGSGSGSGSGTSNEYIIRAYPASGNLCPGDKVDVYLDGPTSSCDSIYFVAQFHIANGDGSIPSTYNDLRHWTFTVPADATPDDWVIEASASGYSTCSGPQPNFPNSTFHSYYVVGGPAAGSAPTGSIEAPDGGNCNNGVIILRPDDGLQLTAIVNDTDLTCKKDALQDTFDNPEAIFWESDSFAFASPFGHQVTFDAPPGVCRAKITLKVKDDATVSGTTSDTNGAYLEVATKTIQFFGLDAVTVDQSGVRPVSADDSVTATLSYVGCPDGLTFTYDLVEISEGDDIRATTHTSETSITFHLFNYPGKYVIKVSVCGSKVVSSDFTLYSLKVNPSSVTFTWDKFAAQLDEIFNPLEKKGVQVSQILQEADVAGDRSEKAAEKLSEKLREEQRIQAELLTLKNAALAAKTAEMNAKAAELAVQAARAAALHAPVLALSAQVDTLVGEIQGAATAAERALLRQELLGVRAALENAISAYREAHAAELALQGELRVLQQLVDGIAAEAKEIAAAGTRLAEALRVKAYNLIKPAAHWLARVITVAGIPFAINEFREAEEATEKLAERTEAAHTQIEKYKSLLESIDNARVKREPSPMRRGITVTTIPGGIKFNLLEIPSFSTWDTDIPNSEARWNFKHLTRLNGIQGLWLNDPERQGKHFITSSGRTGTKPFTLCAYGNFGTSSIYAIGGDGDGLGQVCAVTSNGTTEEGMLAILSGRIALAQETLDKWKILMTKLIATAEIAAGILVLLGWALLETALVTMAVTFGLIVSIVALAVAFLFAILQWLGVGGVPLVDSIKKLYPSTAYPPVPPA